MEGWKQPTTLCITVQDAGVTPEHQILKSEENKKRWMVKSTNNILHKAGSRAYTGTTTTRKVIKLI